MVRLNRLVREQAVLVAVSLAVYAVEVLWLLLESRGNQATMHSTNSWPSGHEERAASSEAAEAAGAPEADIEITPAMIEAGLEARASWDSRFEEIEGLVIEIYEAMERAKRLEISLGRSCP